MSEALTSLDEQKLRGWIRQILKEVAEDAELLREYTGSYGAQPSTSNFAKAFIDPFANIFKAAKVATKGILNAATYNIAALVTFAPSKMEKLRGNYESRKQKIDSEMEAVMKAVHDSAGPDAQMAGFLMAPGAYMAIKGGAATGALAKELVTDGGFRDLGAIVPGISGGKAAGGAAAAGGEEGGIISGILGDLNKLFFVAHYEAPGPRLFEGEEEEKKKDPEPTGDAAEVFQKEFDDMGLSEFVKKQAAELIAAKEEQVKDVLAALEEQLAVGLALTNAGTPEEFAQALEGAKAAGLDMGGDAAQLKKNVQDNVEKIMNNEEAVKEIVDSQREKEGVAEDDTEWKPDEEQTRKDVEVMVTMSAKEDLIEQLGEASGELKNQALELIDEDIEDDEVAAMKTTKEGKQFLAVLDNAIKKIKDM